MLYRLCLLLLLFGTAQVRGEVEVFACEPEWAALVASLGGERIQATSATNALQDPHYIQARPSLIARLRRADLLICSGAGLEVGWLPLLLRKAGNPRVQPGKPGFLMASDHVTRLEIPTVLDRAQGDLHPQGNPHIQTDPRNIAAVARVIVERLAQIDPSHGGDYRQRLTTFEENWSRAITRWEQEAQPLRDVPLVLHHNSWVYLTSWLGLVPVATLESKSGVPPSAAHLNDLLGQLRASPAALIVRTPYQDPKPSEWLTRQTGIPNAILPFTVGGTPEATDLYRLFDLTIATLLASVEAGDE